MKINKTDEPKTIDNSGAYRVLKDKKRLLIEEQIDEMINFPPYSSEIEDTGLFLTEDNESLPVFGPVGSVERVISRKAFTSQDEPAGARIVLTKDNYGHRGTGMGGHGFTMCEAIDIVAGSLSAEKRQHTGATRTRGNFITDGARIYLTERGDIQHYFAVGKRNESISVSSKMKSGIGMKADHTLILGRERVTILAGLANAEGGDRTVGQNERVTPRIELGTTNGSGAQPAVLGTALAEYLQEIKDEMQQLRNSIQEQDQKLMEYKTALSLHMHEGAGLGVVKIFPSPDAISETIESIPKFLKTTLREIRATWNSRQNDWKRIGTSDGNLKGTIEDRILSSTVYIGK
jgi:hypothetical protein